MQPYTLLITFKNLYSDNEETLSLESSGMLRHVVTLKWTNVLEVRTASIIRAMIISAP
jgi:hypothetical protein